MFSGVCVDTNELADCLLSRRGNGSRRSIRVYVLCVAMSSTSRIQTPVKDPSR